jgi:endonuclease-3 related protein
MRHPPLRPWSRKALLTIYGRLLRHHGHGGWWPGETPFEVCLGAILTQNTAWTNVERALDTLRARRLLSFEALDRRPAREIAPLIRPSGYFNVKARRLRAFLDFLGREYGGRVESMATDDPARLRARLLGVPGIGRETADSIVLYAAGHAVFVVDAYTRRIFGRLGFLAGGEDYDTIAARFTSHLPRVVALFNDYHAQIVLLGKDVCRPRPKCDVCPLRAGCKRRGVVGPGAG